MGAVTSLIYAARDPQIVSLVADSAFFNLRNVAKDVAKSKISLPEFLIDGLLSILKATILEKSGLDID